MFITGIGTNVGKTVVSAIAAGALNVPYWKPIQAGDLYNTDSHKVRRWLPDEAIAILPEVYTLQKPMSPHAAAEADGIAIDPEKLLQAYEKHKQQYSTMVIEGAGGLMVPLNDHYLIIDLIEAMKEPVILVSSNYLGSINHTLLSAEALQRRNIPIAGIIFNGEANAATETYILQYTKLKCLLRLRFCARNNT